MDTKELKYSEQRPGRKPVVKGSIELSKIKCVEIVCTDLPIPCTNKYPFQVFYDNHYLYVFAPDNDSRQKWVKALKEETKFNDLVTKYHPNIWADGKWRCCKQTEKLSVGCQAYNPQGLASKKPLPLLPNEVGKMGQSDAVMRIVIAVQEYLPLENVHLRLQKDQLYILISDSEFDWWKVQDNMGNTGLVPSSYVAEKNETNLERFEWYNKHITREEAEDLLIAEEKEGAFMVRDSRHHGHYTVSVFSKVPGPNGEKNPTVKHYQIKKTMEGEPAFYLAENYLFSTIPGLIHYHQHNAAGLITRLRHPVSQDNRFSLVIPDVSQDKWQIDPDELILEETLGNGQFGLVMAGKWRNNRVAVKMIKEECMSEEEFKEEAKVMMKLSHSKLVQLYGVCTQRSQMCLVFEFMEKGALSDYLQARKGRLSQDSLLGMCLDVSEGMAYLESSNLIHRDLAARNCLVAKNHKVKVSDFGMTRFVLDDQYTSSQGSKFPIRWSSPEVIRYAKFSSKSDVWSFGVLMWEVYSEGRLPYGNKNNAQVVDLLNEGIRLLKPRLAPKDVQVLMEWCWKEKPDDRPSFAQLLHQLASLSDQ